MFRAPFWDQNRVAPIGLPAIVEIVQDPHDVAMHVHLLNEACFIDKAQRHRGAALDAEQRLWRMAIGTDAIDRPNVRGVWRSRWRRGFRACCPRRLF